MFFGTPCIIYTTQQTFIKGDIILLKNCEKLFMRKNHYQSKQIITKSPSNLIKSPSNLMYFKGKTSSMQENVSLINGLDIIENFKIAWYNVYF